MTVTKEILDVALVGGGIMSATLGTFINDLEPSWSIALFESQSEVATESSNAWNNAGTGHAALCELNYMPEGADGSLSSAKAIDINQQFVMSREWWSQLVERGVLSAPEEFITAVPHLTFVEGEKDVDYLRRRYETLKNEPLFSDMEYTEDPAVIAEWAPLLIDRRDKSQKVAATRSRTGTDVNFGEVTRQLVGNLEKENAAVFTNNVVTKISQNDDGTWKLQITDKQRSQSKTVNAKFVFVGAGGSALLLLQSAKIPEIKGYGGFPISGKFLRCKNQEVIKQHHAKVYGKAKVGAPPMSVPHLDTRIIDGKEELLFGPYAGFSTNFLKHGGYGALFQSIRPHNLGPMMKVGLTQWALEKYLLKELSATKQAQIETLREYFPAADADDWEMVTAGQRVQIMKKDPEKGGVLQFGTEIVANAEGSIAGLLGASPGASTAVYAMLNLLERCFPEEFHGKWAAKIAESVPSYGKNINSDADLAQATLDSTAKTLKLEV
ncbi:malate dehydrogenase (quinone) [Canibacter zhoujuaniae]|uniref:malate dehydrogenase (quinone) n=1 Tax=Canibacter zhoujuaniae TaxID=2708343 RepID=UPI001AB04560|nr:malate dehydrogenase (quinone) [Canibacter zhoujuaniae]